MATTPASSVLRVLPISIPIAGRRRSLAFRMLDRPLRPTLRGNTVDTQRGSIELDLDHEPERLLAYLFRNVARYYERSELGRWIRETGRSGSTFVDVGANLGMYSLVARSHGMDSVAIEPDPRHAAFLQRNESTFGPMLPVAFSDQPGRLPLFYEANNPGATSLLACAGYVRGEKSISVTTFSVAAGAGLLGDPAEIGIVKVDVEGLEAEVITGMHAFLTEGHRPSIWCEVRGDRSGRNGGSFRRVRERLTDFGYLASERRRGRDLPLDEKELESRAVFDLLFTA